MRTAICIALVLVGLQVGAAAQSEPSASLFINTPAFQKAFQGIAATLAPAAVSASGDSLVWTAQGLPPGLTIDALTGVVSGVPTATGAFTSSLTVSNGQESAQAVVSWNVASPIPDRTTPLSPVGALESVTPPFAWSPVPVARYYALSIVDASSSSAALAWFTPEQAGCSDGISACTVAAPRPLAPGLVSWRVLTWNPFGYGPWSLTATMIVDVPDGATPAPQPLGPAGPIGVRTPAYTWLGVSGAITWYQLSVTDQSGSPRDFWIAPPLACNGTSCAHSPNVLLPIGPAQWRVRAFSAVGAGAWSPATSFDVFDSAPGKATLIEPLSTSTASPVFKWKAMLGTSYYLLRVVTPGNVSIDRWFQPSSAGCQTGTGICTASVGSLSAGPMRWQVLTWNASGYGPWSDPRDFVVEMVDPGAPTPVAIAPTGFVATLNPTYTWTASAGVSVYRLSVRTGDGEPSLSWYTAAAAGCAATPTCSVTPPAGLPNGTLAEWQVQAWTSQGYGTWTSPAEFGVNIAATRAAPTPDEQASSVRLIEYGWDSPTPAFVRDHIDQMEQRPFDGVVMRLPDGGGEVFRPDAWKPDGLASQLAVLHDIKWSSFDSSFLVMYATSSMDWFSDTDWQAVLQHASFMAKAAREGGCRGLVFDPEPYGPSPWNYSEQAQAPAHTFEEYQAMVRARGRAFMLALQQEYPGLDFLTFNGYSFFIRDGVAPNATVREAALTNDHWGLLPAFLDGMLEEADATAQIIDGHEQSYFAEQVADFAKAAADVRDSAFAYVAPGLWDRYALHIQGAQPLYLDWLFGYYQTPSRSLGDGLSDQQRAQLAEHHAYYAMKNVDHYVWSYSEKMNWWTGDNLPAGAEDALRSARQKVRSGEPLGFDLSSIVQPAR